MHITNFQIGDILQRVERCNLHYGLDGSYMHEPLRFEGIEGGIIFLTPLRGMFLNHALSLSADDWADGWDLYPVEIATRLGILK